MELAEIADGVPGGPRKGRRPLLEATDIVKRFGGLVAVSDASLTVPEGRIVSLIGPNGAGKTTLFAVIAGFLKPDAGRVTFAGADITPMKAASVPLMGIRVDHSTYFDIHHSEADTLDKVDPAELSRCVGTMALMAYVLADMPTRLGER